MGSEISTPPLRSSSLSRLRCSLPEPVAAFYDLGPFRVTIPALTLDVLPSHAHSHPRLADPNLPCHPHDALADTPKLRSPRVTTLLAPRRIIAGINALQSVATSHQAYHDYIPPRLQSLTKVIFVSTHTNPDVYRCRSSILEFKYGDSPRNKPFIHSSSPADMQAYRPLKLQQSPNLRKALKDAMRDSRVLLGVGAGIPAVATVKILAALAADWCWIDAEHTPMSPTLMAEMARRLIL
ncbi:hypothetical protein FIBSPDRAFT_965432 [Athelia psychrophila]|uniref:Uncharacterized protein n=1 Tax=Athelia psychrophila TaxID=1759441 RepID=A0A165WL58_9AGAM|nr:hypothetical protein FIBSPDRAFT_965432 [Fibularhizoctonia sp. CBS 109695]